MSAEENPEPFRLYSDRQSRLRKSGESDLYQYNTVSRKLRTQITQILNDCLGRYRQSVTATDSAHNNQIWNSIVRLLKKELGVHDLNDLTGRRSSLGILNSQTDLIHLLTVSSPSLFIDALEVCCRFMSELTTYDMREIKRRGGVQHPKSGLSEINRRMLDDGLGFQYDDGHLFRVDSEFLHAEGTKPTLALLRGKKYEGAEQEFRDAHIKYRNGDTKAATVSALKAVESTAKAICNENDWKVPPNAQISGLVKVLQDNALFPEYLGKWFEQLVATLKTGMPMVRNREGGHGQGRTIKTVPSHVAAFALHQAAASILFLVDSQSDYLDK